MVACCNNKKCYSHSSIFSSSKQMAFACKVKKTRNSSVEGTDRSIQLLCKGFDYHLNSLDYLEQKLEKVRKKKEMVKWAVATIRTFQPVFERIYGSMLENVNAEVLVGPFQADRDDKSIFECLYKLFLEGPENYLNLAAVFIDGSFDSPSNQLLSHYDRREANLCLSRDFYLREIKEIHIKGQREPILSYDFIKLIRNALSCYKNQNEGTTRNSPIHNELNMGELFKLMQGYSLN